MNTYFRPALWEGEAFFAAVGGKVLRALPASIGGISIDSRSLQQGEAFFAIRGERFDGHDFAEAASKAGAALLVVEKKKAEDLRHVTCPLILVEDVLGSLESLARAARARLCSSAKVIAVTGSVGKTTIKEAIRTLLGKVGNTYANPASFNNHWGVPLTLARMRSDTDFAIFEIGMNHRDEIRPLVHMVRPHIGVISSVAKAHVAAFASLKEIAAAKAEIFDGIISGGYALLNADDDFHDFLEHAAKAAGVDNIARFGEATTADYRLLKADLADNFSRCTVSLHDTQHTITIPMPGRHMIQNMLAVLGAADLAGAQMAQICQYLPQLTAPQGRGRHHKLKLPDGGECTLIDESYNANPASMQAALAVLAAMSQRKTGQQEQRRRIAVLGDMLELGKQSQQAHENLATHLMEAKVDKVFLTGQEMRHLASKLDHDGPMIPYIWRETAQELQSLIASFLRDGDIISIKSSNAIGSSKIIANLLQQFS